MPKYLREPNHVRIIVERFRKRNHRVCGILLRTWGRCGEERSRSCYGKGVAVLSASRGVAGLFPRGDGVDRRLGDTFVEGESRGRDGEESGEDGETGHCEMY